jgi:hypothetical protein
MRPPLDVSIFPIHQNAVAALEPLLRSIKFPLIIALINDGAPALACNGAPQTMNER